MSTSAHRSLVTGSFWISVSEVAKAVAEIASTVVAARLLLPEDIGLIGIVLLTIATLEAFSKTGFDQALVQKQDAIEPYLNVAWTWHVLRGFGIAALLAIAAPFIAQAYDEPLVASLIWVSCLQVVLQGFQNIGVVFFSRTLNFKTICAVNALRAFAHAGVAIPAVLYFRNVWGLVVGIVASAAIGLIISYLVHPYRPRFEWSWPKLRELITFGRWITGLSLMVFIVTQGDDIFVSLYLGPAALAFYQLAYNLSNLPATKITHVISQVSFPTYARLLGDPDALRPAFLGVMRATILLSAPVAVAIWMITPGLVEHVIGPKWAPIIPLVSILLLSAFVRSVVAIGGALFQACGRPDLDFKMNVPRFLSVVFLVYPFTAAWGLIGASWVVTIAILTTVPTFLYGTRLLVGVSFRELLTVNLPAVVSGGLLAGAFLVAQATVAALVEPSLPAFIAEVVLAVLLWLGLVFVLGKFTPFDLFGEVRRLKQLAS